MACLISVKKSQSVVGHGSFRAACSESAARAGLLQMTHRVLLFLNVIMLKVRISAQELRAAAVSETTRKSAKIIIKKTYCINFCSFNLSIIS